MRSEGELSGRLYVVPSYRGWTLVLAICLLLLLLKAVFLNHSQQFELLWRLSVLGAAGWLIFDFVRIATTKYSLDAIEICGGSGVFWRTVTRIPLNRISNYEARTSLLQRLLGTGDLLIDTPGSLGCELTLKGLNRVDREALADALSLLIGEQKVADAGMNLALRDARIELLKSQSR